MAVYIDVKKLENRNKAKLVLASYDCDNIKELEPAIKEFAIKGGFVLMGEPIVVANNDSLKSGNVGFFVRRNKRKEPSSYVHKNNLKVITASKFYDEKLNKFWDKIANENGDGFYITESGDDEAEYNKYFKIECPARYDDKKNFMAIASALIPKPGDLIKFIRNDGSICEGTVKSIKDERCSVMIADESSTIIETKSIIEIPSISESEDDLLGFMALYTGGDFARQMKNLNQTKGN